MNDPIQLGLRANAAQFGHLVGLNALVGAMVGLERSVLPLVGRDDFGLESSAAILAFVLAFGAAKALSNLVSGELAERIGRKRLLVLGWALVLPVAPLIALAPSWWVVVAANVLLGASQGFAWSMTIVMKIDLAGPRRRGLALGLNEAAGYLGVAAAAFASGALAATYAPRTVVWVGAAVVSTAVAPASNALNSGRCRSETAMAGFVIASLQLMVASLQCLRRSCAMPPQPPAAGNQSRRRTGRLPCRAVRSRSRTRHRPGAGRGSRLCVRWSCPGRSIAACRPRRAAGR